MVTENPAGLQGTPLRDGTDAVLCVDLDGTLVRTDMLWESLVSAVRRQPAVLARAWAWAFAGRARLKAELAAASSIDVETLPYREEVIALLVEARRAGRLTVLATASDARIAGAIASHLGLFDEVLASDGATNLKGEVKAAKLVERYGRGRYDYVGDSRADVPCWESAGAAWSTGLSRSGSVPHLKRVPPAAGPPSTLRRLFKALRPHQWLKNLLVFVPLFAAHAVTVRGLWQAVVSLATLSAVASGGYVLNDLLDVGADRRHSRKRHRPFAAGHLAIPTGLALIGGLWAAGFGLALVALPRDFAWILAGYLAGSVAYSLALKREAVLDVIFLAGLYVVRVVAGGLATGVPVSTWLLAFTLFVCLSLAFMKRFIEIIAQGAETLPGRGYGSADAAWLQSAGLSSAYLSVVILAIYANNPDVTRLYAHPERLLLMCPIMLYWATRTWLRASRRQLHDDPVVAVVLDPVTHVLAALSAAVVWSAM